MTWYVVSFVLVVAAGYAVSCWRWPTTACAREACEAGKIFRLPDKKVWRDCRRCDGTGKRIRVGRRVFNWWYLRRQASR